MSNWKTVVGVVGGSLLVLVLITLGMSRLSGQSERGVKIEGVEGESRLVLGNKEGSIILTEFSDFQCPACEAAQPLVKGLLSKYKEIKLVYREFPLTDIHPNSNPAALAAEAANEQGKFVEYHDWLFLNRAWVDKADPTEDFVAASGELGLDRAKFEDALKKKTYQKAIDGDVSDGLRFGVRATPSFYVNGVKTATRDLEVAIKQAIGG